MTARDDLYKRIPEPIVAQDFIGCQMDHWLHHVLSALVTNCAENFSGLGLILYRAPLALPVLPMVLDAAPLRLPTQDINESVALLMEICRFDSDFHDGFHLVDAQTLQITHVSHFFSPKITDIPPSFWRNQHVGARFMSAWLGSQMPTVCRTAILSKEEGGVVFTTGDANFILPCRSK